MISNYYLYFIDYINRSIHDSKKKRSIHSKKIIYLREVKNFSHDFIIYEKKIN